MIIAGLTGNLGSGKTTVLQMFKGCGAAVVDADEIAHMLMAPGGRCFSAVKKRFPKAYTDGKIQRKILADIVFPHPRLLRDLEKILHPAVRNDITKQIKALSKMKRVRMAVVDVPLLFEAEFDDLFDAVIVVRSTQKLMSERLRKNRGMPRRQVLSRLKHQMPQAEKMKRADFIVDNRGTKAKTRAQVKRIWDGLVNE